MTIGCPGRTAEAYRGNASETPHVKSPNADGLLDGVWPSKGAAQDSEAMADPDIIFD